MATPPWANEEFRVIFGRTKIEYDEKKDEINRKEKKYALESAVDLLTGLAMPGAYRPYINRDASTVEECRHEHMTIDDSHKVVFFVTTMRDNETVRVISLRQASPQERQVFAELTGFIERDAQPGVPANLRHKTGEGR